MKLWRAILGLLLLLNLAYFLWSQGHLLPYGLGPQKQAEPERLLRQINPDALRVLPSAPNTEPGP